MTSAAAAPALRNTRPPRPARNGSAITLGITLCSLAAMLGGCGDGSTEGKASPIKYTNVFGGLGDTPGRFGYPRCIDHDASALWIIDKTARVQRIDPNEGKCLAVFHMPEWELGKPTGLCIAPGPDKNGRWCDDLMYIADTHYHRVMVYNPPRTAPVGDVGTLVPESSWGSYGDGAGQFYYPTDVAVLLKTGEKVIDRIFVSEYGGNDRVSVFNAAHEFLFSFGSQGMGTDPTKIEFNRPQSLALRTKADGTSELVVVDACNHRLGRFTIDGKLIGWIGSAATQGREPGHFYVPYGIVILPDGTAMVSEFGGARAQRIDLDTGRSLGCWGEPGREPGQVLAPWAITWMNDSVYLLDSGNNRITAFRRPS